MSSGEPAAAPVAEVQVHPEQHPAAAASAEGGQQGVAAEGAQQEAAAAAGAQQDAPAEGSQPQEGAAPEGGQSQGADGDGGEEGEEQGGQELFRLFVGALPKEFHESDLRPLFGKFGSLKQVTVLREADGTGKGCGFVLFESKEDAERAIAALDKSVTLPGQLQPMEVRFAKKPALVKPGTGGANNKQLFFSGGPPGVSRKDVLQVFSYYGKVEHIHLFMDYRTKLSKGCGFVTFGARQEAENAMKALDQTYTMPGSRMVLSVRWADPDLQERKRRAAEGLSEDDRQLFVAKVLKSSPPEDVQQLFSHYGTVEKVSMFKPAPDAIYHKGCGVVTMARREDAEAALRALDETYTWPGMTEPLVVKWMDADFNKRKRFEPSLPQFVSLEPPPPGCEPDALKLYVGNIPTSYTVDDIRQVFKQYGRVIQILIARDKETHQPKGSAYIWYQRRRESELAIKRLNGSNSMPDPANPNARPLLVTVAQQSVAPVRTGPGGGQMAVGGRFGGAAGAAAGGRFGGPRPAMAGGMMQQQAPGGYMQQQGMQGAGGSYMAEGYSYGDMQQQGAYGAGAAGAYGTYGQQQQQQGGVYYDDGAYDAGGGATYVAEGYGPPAGQGYGGGQAYGAGGGSYGYDQGGQGYGAAGGGGYGQGGGGYAPPAAQPSPQLPPPVQPPPYYGGAPAGPPGPASGPGGAYGGPPGPAAPPAGAYGGPPGAPQAGYGGAPTPGGGPYSGGYGAPPPGGAPYSGGYGAPPPAQQPGGPAQQPYGSYGAQQPASGYAPWQ